MECRTINCVAVTGATSSIGTFFVEECIRREGEVGPLPAHKRTFL